MDDGGRGAASPDEGGDPVCWIDQVCPECGRVVGADVGQCPFCEARIDDDGPIPPPDRP